MPRITIRRIKTTPENQTAETIRAIGAGIVAGSKYLPIRNLAARVAATAKPKDYLGQARAIWDHILRRWRYVRDPFGAEMVATDPAVVFGLVLGGDGRGAGGGFGVGDCDDIAVGSGAMLGAIGFPVRIATTAPVGGGPWSHVFTQFNLAGQWITFDPVLHPGRGFGDVADHSRIKFWSLDGRPLEERQHMQIEHFGLAGVEGDDRELVDMADIVRGFGSGIASLGYVDDPGYHVELSGDEYSEGGYTLNPVLELSGDDFRRVQQSGPYHGMLALGDDGSLYQYDQNLGFFKRLRRGFRRAFKRVRSAGKKILSRVPGGKTLMKIHRRIMPIARRLIKVGSKIAPIAAFIPGIGPAAAIALKAAGRGVDMVERAQRIARVARLARGRR